MPNWKKLIVSGSDASLNSLNVTNNVTAQSFTGSFSGSFTAPGATTQVVYNNGGVLSADSGFVYSGSRVGIGTTSPQYKLDVNGSFNALTSGVYLTYNSGILYHGNYYQFTSGNNYLLFARTSGDLILGSNDTERIRISSAGNVGIGTTSPSSSLDVVVSSGGTSGLRFRGYSDAATPYLLSLGTFSYPDHFQINSVNGLVTMGIVGATGANPDLAFQTNTTERMRILSNGNVGIGTTSPTTKLDVIGNSYISGSLSVKTTSTAGTGLTVGGSIVLLSFAEMQQGNAFYFYSSGNTYGSTITQNGQNLILTPDTNVGIGTTSPTAKLEVNGNVKATSFTGSFSGSVSAPGSTTQIVYNDNGVLAASSGLVYSGSNVGIGISSPTEKLHIVSSAAGNQFGRITATDATASAAWVAQNDSGDNVVYRVFSSGVSGTQMGAALGRSASLLANLGGSGVFLLGTFSNTNFILGTNNTENMRITTAGNVGIGTSSPNVTLEANGKVRSTRSGVASQYLEVDGGTSGAVYLTAAGASKPFVIQNNNTTQSDIWFDQAVASPYLWLQAGTEKMRLNASGNVGIGTTSPSQLLEVQGQAQIGNDSVTSAGLFFARKNTNQAKSHYFLSAQESPTYQWIEGGYFTSELAGVSVANNSGKPYYESYAPAGQNKSFGFINQTTSGSSFTSTAATASMTLYQGGNIALAYNGGNVGIGTSSPTTKFVVSNAGVSGFEVDPTGGVSSGVLLQAYNRSTSAYMAQSYYALTHTFSVGSGAGTRALDITSAGNVGIGTTSPSAPLAFGKAVYGDPSSENFYRIKFEDVGGTHNDIGIGQPTAGSLGFNVAALGYISFNEGTSGERVRIAAGGNVGIGTTTPIGILHLYKSAAATRLAIDGDAGQNRLISYRTGAVQRFGLYVNNTAESGANAGSNFAIRAYSDAGTLLSTPFFINRASGNVGIGTTSPGYKLEVVGAVSASTYYGDGSNLTGIGSGSVAAAGSDGQLQYNNSGLFGGASRLYYNDTTNKVGIGTSSPGYDLDVSGSVRVQDKLRVGPINTGNGVIHQSSDATINASSSTIVWSVPGSSGAVAFIEYYIINTVTSTSQRGGNIVVTWNSAGTPQITHTETTTPDIGTTALVTFTTSITLGGDPQLVATNTSINPFYIVLNYRYF